MFGEQMAIAHGVVAVSLTLVFVVQAVLDRIWVALGHTD